ncbi:MAG: DUF6261 family protein [Dysgonamonadaceae bacterium]|jgi:hypothetical protein|nr:DUF6261 family protein [Dysgonamonadaceae bacterium]
MAKFIGLNFSYLPNDAHYNYVSNFDDSLKDASEAIETAVGSLVDDFDALCIEESDLMKWVRKSDLTKKIQAADRDLDRTFSALRAVVRGLTYSKSTSILPSADYVYTMLMKYGNVNVKPYEDQCGIVKAVIENVSAGGDYATDVSILAAAPSTINAAISDLKQSLTTFETLLGQRDKKKMKKPKRSFKVVRREIEIVYHKITEIIDAYSISSTDASFNNFIDLNNEEIDRLNGEHQHVRYSIAKSQPAKIPDQQYTGYPVTPVPEVLFKDSDGVLHHLSLGKDFYLKYKDNKEVGNATMFIHGTGKYKGKRTTVFIIHHT